MRYITEEAVQRLLPMTEAVRLVGEAFRAWGNGHARNQPRRRLETPTGAVLHQMAATCGRYLGAKVYSTHAHHGAHFMVLLYDAATAEPLAQIEAGELGRIRTGAATGFATDLLAHRDARTVGMIGAGFQAWTQLEALAAVRNVVSARVYSRSLERRTEFAINAARAFGLDVIPAASAEEALRGAHMVVTATSAREPVLESAWVFPGAHVNAVGGNQAERREVPAELVRRARLIAVDSLEQARIESGDLLLAVPAERWSELPLVELSELACGRRPANHSGDVTLFESHGLALEDLAVAGWVYEQARREVE